MSLAPRLDLRQSQALVMTPQLQQAIKLLALSNLELETFVGEAIEANPLLELAERPSEAPEPLAEAPSRTTSLESSPVDRLIGEGRAEEDRPLDIEAADPAAVGGAGESYAAPTMAGEGSGDDDRPDDADSLAEHLHAQVGASARDSRTLFVARWLIDQLDEAGYLTVSVAEAAQDLGLPDSDVAAGLALVQSLDPTGVGARTLAECLALQAREADRYDPCMARLIDNLDLVAKGAFAQLKRMCKVDDEDFADMLNELRSYDPKPGLRFGNRAGEAAVTPDILLRSAAGGSWDITLNQATLPRLLLNRDYYVQLKTACADKDARGWLNERLADASWLIKALDQRQRTILKVAAEIVRCQEGFFRHGVSQLKPLTLRAVAEAVKLHESTISRVTSNKYIQCARGTFELKYFFTSGVAASNGQGDVSAEAVKDAIRTLIDNESPKAILSDDTLVDLLAAKGFVLARRTVAKYREAIGLGSSVQRRRQKALAEMLEG